MKILAIGFSLVFICFSNVHGQAPFYEGKTIRIVVGLPAGDALRYRAALNSSVAFWRARSSPASSVSGARP